MTARYRAAFSVLVAVTALLQVTLWAVRPLVAYRGLHLGASVAELGLLASAFSAFALVAALPAGRWADRAGERPVLIVGTILFAASSLGMVLTESLLGLGILYALLGLGRVLCVVAVQAFVPTLSTEENQDQRFGIQQAGAALGQVVGPAAAGLIAGAALAAGAPDAVGAVGAQRVFLWSGIATLLTLPVVLILPTRPREVSTARTSPRSAPVRVREILRRRNMMAVMAGSVALVTGLDLLVTFLPAYGEREGISVQAIGMLLSLRALASIVSRLCLGLLVKGFGALRVLTGTMLIAGGAIGLLPLSSEVWVLAVLLLIAGFGLGVGQPLTLSWISRIAPGESRATAIALRLLGNRIGQFAIPALFGVIGAAVGLAGVFLALALGLGGSGALLHARTRAAPVDQPEQRDK